MAARRAADSARWSPSRAWFLMGMRQRRIALYGGTFDPVHIGHLTVARALLTSFILDEVVFIPAHVAPHKRGAPPATTAWQRFAMLALATQEDPTLRVSTIELESPERPYTFETLGRLLNESGGGARLFFVMGADSWAEINTWREWEGVLLMTDHLVVTRPGFPLDAGHVPERARARIVDLRGANREETARALDESPGPAIFFTDVVEINVSATEIRHALADDSERAATLRQRVPLPVANFIEKYELYRNRHEPERITADDRH